MSDRPPPSRPRWRQRKLAITCACLPALVVIAELEVRLFTDVERPVLAVDALVGRRYVANLDQPVWNAESEREVPLRFNSQGLRFPELPFEKPEGTRRLIVIGDSMIAGLEVNEEDTAVAQLQVALRERCPDPRWEVLNFGISGSGTGQQLVLYREVARRYQPDVVLLSFFVGNDFSDNNSRLSKSRRVRFDLGQDGQLVHNGYPNLRQRLNGLLDTHSRLYVWQKQLTTELKMRRLHAARSEELGDARYAWHGSSIRNPDWVFYTGDYEEARYSWVVTGAEVRALAQEVQADGASLRIFMMPSPLQVYDDDFAFVRGLAGEHAELFDREHPARRLAELCEALDAPFLDPLSDFRGATPAHSSLAEDELLHYLGFGHLNERGHTVVAEALERWLTEGQLLSAKRNRVPD